jgi:hypothetical protein
MEALRYSLAVVRKNSIECIRLDDTAHCCGMITV